MATTSGYYFYLDGTLLDDEPLGLEDFAPTINRDVENRFIGIKYPLELTFIGDGYELIKSRIRSGGRVQALNFELRRDIEDGYGQNKVIDGSVLLTEGVDAVWYKEWKTRLRDNSYSRYIYSYLETGISLIANKSIDQTTITPISSFDLQIVDVGSATTQYLQSDITVKAFDFKDVMTQMVNYLSNGTLTFSSSWYDSLGYGIAVIPQEYMTFKQSDPIMTFKEVFLTVARLYNLYLSASGSQLLLETESYYQSLSSVLSLEDIREKEVTYKTNYLYSSIVLGNVDPEDLLDDTQENGLSKYAKANTYFKTLNLRNTDDVSMNTELDLRPLININCEILIEGVKQKINGASQHFETRTGTPGYTSAVYPFSSIGIDSTSFNQESDRPYLTTYNTSTNIQNSSSYVIDSTTYYRTNNEFSNSNVLSRYEFYSDYAKEQDTTDSTVYSFWATNANTCFIDSYLYSLGQYTTVTPSNNDVIDFIGDENLTSDQINNPVTVRVTVMFPRCLQSGDDLDVYDDGLYPANNSSGAIGDDFVEVPTDVSYLNLIFGFRYDGTAYTTTLNTPLTGVPYTYEYTFTPTSTDNFEFIATVDDGVEDVVLSPRYILTVLGFSVQAENSNRVFKAKSADAYAVSNKFEYPLTDSQIDTLLSNPFAAITIDGKTAYHDSTRINVMKKTVEFEVLTTKDNLEDEYLI